MLVWTLAFFSGLCFGIIIGRIWRRYEEAAEARKGRGTPDGYTVSREEIARRF